MSGHHDFNELIKNFTPERRVRVNKKKAELLAAVPALRAPQSTVINARGTR